MTYKIFVVAAFALLGEIKQTKVEPFGTTVFENENFDASFCLKVVYNALRSYY